MMIQDEIYISGIGLITALGVGKAQTWNNLCEGQSGIRLIKRFDTTGAHTKFAAEIPEAFEAFFTDHFSKRTARHTALFSQLCLASTHQALEDSGLVLEKEDPTRIGICIGTGAGGLSYWEKMILDTGGDYDASLPQMEALAVIKYMSNAPSAVVSQYFGIEGPSLTVSTSCASGANAIGHAYDMIKLGRADVVIAGGVEALVSKVAISSFSKLQALSERNDDPARASRPFDKLRDGFVLGDGAGILILESPDHCRKRGAKPYAKICGYAVTSEAHHMVHPAENGRKMAVTMRRALCNAAIDPEQVDYISAHGTSTVLNDKYETTAIKEVFGTYARRLAISSQKSMLGHTVGAAGAIELAVTALSIRTNIITPTINYEYPDEDCDLDYTPNAARARHINVALSNSFGFGGHNCTIVLARP